MSDDWKGEDLIRNVRRDPAGGGSYIMGRRTGAAPAESAAPAPRRRGAVYKVAREQYAACAEEGLTQAQTAVRLGVTREAVRQAGARHGLIFKPGRGKR